MYTGKHRHYRLNTITMAPNRNYIMSRREAMKKMNYSKAEYEMAALQLDKDTYLAEAESQRKCWNEFLNRVLAIAALPDDECVEPGKKEVTQLDRLLMRLPVCKLGTNATVVLLSHRHNF